jgi:hypothetical protein
MFAGRVVCNWNEGGTMKHATNIKGRLARIAAIGGFLVGFFCMPGAVVAAPEAPPKKPTPILQAPPPSPNTVTAPLPFKNRKSVQQLAPWSVSLSASPYHPWPTQYATLTATSNQDVGPTPYYISIYDLSTNTFVAVCGSGTTCSVSVTSPTGGARNYYAYVSYYPSSHPPAEVQASTLYALFWKSVITTLQANAGTHYLGLGTTLTATTTVDIGPSPFWTSIYDTATGTRLVVCGYSTTCSVSVGQSLPGTYRYIAYLSSNSAAYPPAGIQSTSNSAYLTWTAADHRVVLTSTFVEHGREMMTATTNFDVGPTPYWISIYSLITGARVAVCGGGTTCSSEVRLVDGINSFAAFVSSWDPALPPANIQANSNTVNFVYWEITKNKLAMPDASGTGREAATSSH